MRFSSILMSLCLMIFLFSCNYSGEQTKDEQNSENAPIDTIDAENPLPENRTFDEYLSLFTPAELPITIESFEIDQTNLVSTENEAYKEVRIKSGFGAFTFYPYKRITTQQEFYTLISLEESNRDYNLWVPVLETYSLEGELIDIKALDFGGERTETSSVISQTATIYPNLTFSFELKHETWDVTEEKDENGNYFLKEVPGSLVQEWEFAQGRIDQKGIIHIDPYAPEEIVE